MASTQSCSGCHKTTGKTHCTGCDNHYCIKYFRIHRQLLDDELGNIVNERDLIQDALDKSFKSNNSFDTFKQAIDQWEKKMLSKVKETAENARKELGVVLNKMEKDIASRFKSFSQTMIQLRDDEDYVETDLTRLNKQIKEFRKDIDYLRNRREMLVFEDTSDRIPWQKLLWVYSKYEKRIQLPQIPFNATWSGNATTILTGLSQPRGIAVDQEDGTAFVADYSNKRVLSLNPDTGQSRVIASNLGGPTDVLFDKETNSVVIADYGNRKVLRWSLGNEMSQGETIVDNIGCWGLTTDNEGSLYVCDHMKHEVRKFSRGEKIGTLVAGGNGAGNGNHQLNSPLYVALDAEYSLYISDWNNHRVVKWRKGAKEGTIAAGGNGTGSEKNQLHYPHGVVVDSLENIYVAEYQNRRVTRWREGETTGEIIVFVNGEGNGVNQLSGPTGLSFDKQHNLYVADLSNNCIQRFSIK